MPGTGLGRSPRPRGIACRVSVLFRILCLVLFCPALFLLCFALLSGLVPVLTYFVFLCFAVSNSLLAPRERWGGQLGSGRGRVTFVSCEFHVNYT